MNRNLVKIQVLLAMIIIMTIFSSIIVSASASLRGPATEERRFLYDSGRVIEMDFDVAGAPILEVYLRGRMVENTELTDPNPEGGARHISIKLTVPNDLPAGKNILWVGVREKAPEGAMFGGRAGAEMGITVTKLYDEPTIETQLNIVNTGEGKNTDAFVEVTSLCSMDLEGVFSEISVFKDKSSEELFSIKTPSQTVKAGKKTTLKTILPVARLEKGNYKAIATTYYEDNVSIAERNFLIGTKGLELKDYSEKLTIDKINKAHFTIRNLWDQEEKVYLKLVIDGKEIDTSPTKSINGFGEQKYELYIDTEDYDLGLLNATLIGYFEDSKEQFDIQFNISEEKVAEVIEEKETPTTIKTIYFAYTILIILVIINLIVLFTKDKKKK